MANLGLRVLKKGLDPSEAGTLTFEQLRQERLEALRDGEPVERSLPRPGGMGAVVRTTAPTLDHLAVALDVPLSSLRAYSTGRNQPRMTIAEMLRFAAALGLTAEELGSVIVNTRRQRVL